jgi:anaerobic selenocysteine-containing dehydrogenase
MVYFSPEVKGPRMEEARPEWEIYSDLAGRVRPEDKGLITFKNAAEIRAEIAAAAPDYNGIQDLNNRGDVFQWGGAWLCEDGICPTEDGKGRLISVEIPELRKAEGHFYVTTRRGKQFNSMVYSSTDPFNGANRDDVFMSSMDAKALGLSEGEAIVVYNRHGMFHGKVKYENVKEKNIALFWPEGNMLFPKGVYESFAGIPEYNAGVIVEKAETFYAQKDLRYVEKRLEELETEAG